MVANGFHSSWFSMEFFLTYDDDTLDIKLIEINGRMSTPMLRIYPVSLYISYSR